MTTQETMEAVPLIKKHSTGSKPVTDIKIKDLAQVIASNWKLNPQITLLWTEPNAFEDSAHLFDTSLDERLKTGGSRAVVTNDLKTLNVKIDRHIDFVKDYLKEKYGKENYYSYFPQFGIIKYGNSFILPPDHNKRSEAMKLLLQAITTNELQDRTYGLAFWQDISQKYDLALKSTISTDGSIAGLVKTKNEHRQQLVKTLNALIHAIKANYPDTWASVLREWGFQKEKY